VDTTGVTFNVGTGKMKVQVCQADVIRVQYTTASSIPAKSSLSVNMSWGAPSFCVTEAAGTVTITTARIKAKVSTSNGVVSYTDLDDKPLVAEDSKSLTATTISGGSTNKVQASFASPASEALFGLGQHKDGVVNKKGKRVHFHNLNDNHASSPTSGGDLTVPLLVSSKGYGIFWDNPADGDFYGKREMTKVVASDKVILVTGRGCHPSSAGYQQMADSVDLTLFSYGLQKPPTRKAPRIGQLSAAPQLRAVRRRPGSRAGR
jgi:alpha-D-xyloside xylohydrolase